MIPIRAIDSESVALSQLAAIRLILGVKRETLSISSLPLQRVWCLSSIAGCGHCFAAAVVSISSSGRGDFLIPTSKLPRLVRLRAARSSIVCTGGEQYAGRKCDSRAPKTGSGCLELPMVGISPNGNRVHRRIVLGTAEQLRDLSSARKLTTGLIREINVTDIRMAGTS